MSVLLRGNLPKINIICDFRQEIEECFCLDGIMFKGDFCQNEIGDIIRKTSEKDNTLCEKNIDKKVADADIIKLFLNPVKASNLYVLFVINSFKFSNKCVLGIKETPFTIAVLVLVELITNI